MYFRENAIDIHMFLHGKLYFNDWNINHYLHLILLTIFKGITSIWAQKFAQIYKDVNYRPPRFKTMPDQAIFFYCFVIFIIILNNISYIYNRAIVIVLSRHITIDGAIMQKWTTWPYQVSIIRAILTRPWTFGRTYKTS